jgi:UDP-N-acetylglucosamine 2-epimerase (non-hydrolysing)
MYEVLNQNMDKIQNSKILDKLELESGKYFIVSFHREENVDNEWNLKKILAILDNLAGQYGLPVIVSTHPRTKKRIEAVTPNSNHQSLITFLKPFSFTDYIHLQMRAKCAVSDSGTISEESAILNFPAISLRQSMERPEAQDAGTIILTGFDKEVVLNSIEAAISEHSSPATDRQIPFEYRIPDTSHRVLNLILGNARLSNKWYGIDS